MQGSLHGNNGKRRAFCWGAFSAVLTMAAPAALAAPTETVLHSFADSDGAFPRAGLIADSSGNLYGTTGTGGGASGGKGVVFKLTPSGTFMVLHSFSVIDGNSPTGLIADSNGNLYGTTELGGAPGCNRPFGCGVVFKLAPSGTETVLYSFKGGSDGAFPEAGLILDSSGNLYGTTENGGGSGDGTVFKLAPDGTETVLYSFKGGSDGASPFASLIADSSGNLYGTTGGGGGPGCGGSGCGVVFKLAPSGTEMVLHTFTGGNDGASPLAGLIADGSGNLYGTTQNGGGPVCGGGGCGVVFKLTPSGSETVLHAFTGGTDGASPQAGLILDSSGNLYGTTVEGGGSGCHELGCGVVFNLASSGTETVLYSFCSLANCSDGANPFFAGLIADSSGNLYGTTRDGGGLGGCVAGGCGTVFKLAGTGFATGIPFLAFRGKLEIAFGETPNTDSFELRSEFTLSSTAPAINPVGEPVTLQIGTFKTTIPPGSFKQDKDGDEFEFEGTVKGVRLEALIKATGTLRYKFKAEAEDANLAGTKNPVPVTLAIGNDTGTVSIHAKIDSDDEASGCGREAQHAAKRSCENTMGSNQ